ncbi:hypothetical protein ZWY2020_031782 [Hordeum vulgare]|nr:hypothetical protein ZWY2020_031782 [Hordeum vulgare]
MRNTATGHDEAYPFAFSTTTRTKSQHLFCLAGEAGTEAEQAELLSLEKVRSYTPGSLSACAAQFIKRTDLEASEHLRNDSFTIRCDIAVVQDFRAVYTTGLVSVPPCDLGRHLGELLETEKDADVVFEVGGETVSAHRCVLAARSPVFAAELRGPMKEGDVAAGGVVRIQDLLPLGSCARPAAPGRSRLAAPAAAGGMPSLQLLQLTERGRGLLASRRCARTRTLAVVSGALVVGGALAYARSGRGQRRRGRPEAAANDGDDALGRNGERLGHNGTDGRLAGTTKRRKSTLKSLHFLAAIMLKKIGPSGTRYLLGLMLTTVEPLERGG